MMKLLPTLLIGLTGVAVADTATLHILRSPGLDWSTPQSLARDTVINSILLVRYPIGHVAIELQCGKTNIISGIHPTSMSEMISSITSEQQGMGVLFRVFPGEREEETHLRKFFQGQRNSNRYASIRMEVSPQSCNRMMEFHQEIVKHDYDRWYGFPARPEYGEGGGCSAWVMGYLRAGGIRQDWMVKQWARFILVPPKTVGTPITNTDVPLGSLLNDKSLRWAYENEAHFPLFAYDPDLMYIWAQENKKSSDKVPRVNINLKRFHPGAESLFVSIGTDPRDVMTEPSKISSLWLEEIAIWKKTP